MKKSNILISFINTVLEILNKILTQNPCSTSKKYIMNRSKKKNWKIITIDAEKALDKIHEGNNSKFHVKVSAR